MAELGFGSRRSDSRATLKREPGTSRGEQGVSTLGHVEAGESTCLLLVGFNR